MAFPGFSIQIIRGEDLQVVDSWRSLSIKLRSTQMYKYNAAVAISQNPHLNVLFQVPNL